MSRASVNLSPLVRAAPFDRLSDGKCRAILSNCAEALPEPGTILISESILDSTFAGRNLANLKDLVMLVANESDARGRSEDEYRAPLDEAGFDVVEAVRLEVPRDLLVAKKRGTETYRQR